MAAPLTLEPQPPRQLTGAAERGLLEQAMASGRGSAAITLKLACLCNRLDRFDQAIALLDRTPPASFAAAQALATALAGRRAPGDDQRALAVAREAEQLAESDHHRALALVDQARACWRLGDRDTALALFDRALAANPHNAEALDYLTRARLAAAEPERVLALVARLRASGVAHSQLLGSETLALAQSGERPAARELLGLTRHLHCETITPPPGWATLDQFNAELVGELLDSPGLRDGRHGSASIDTLRIDEPVTTATPAMRALQDLIAQRVMAVVARWPSGEHPWLAQRPRRASLRLWAVITGHGGHERWHMHPQGWASGGYYPAVPAAVASGQGRAGFLEFGLPPHLGADAAAAFGTTLLRPQPGLLCLFPAHAFHHTLAHGTPEHRICVAFDVVPT